MEPTSRIVLSRSSEWMNRARSFKVMIDGQQAGSISNGGTEEFKLEPEQHKIFCKVDWCSSREFDVNIAAGETAYLHVKSGMKYYWQFTIPLLIVLALNFYFTYSSSVRPMWFNYLLLAIAVPSVIYILYYTLFSRKDYLALGRDETTLFGK